MTASSGSSGLMRTRERLARRLEGVGVALLATFVLTAAVPATADDLFEPNPHPHSVVVDWAEAMLIAIPQNPPAPTVTTWRMWVVMSAIYDAWSMYHPTAMPTEMEFGLKRPAHEQTESNMREAVSHAAHRTLSIVYPNQEALFDQVLSELGFAASDSSDPTTPAGIGNIAAQNVIDARLADGSNASGGFLQLTSDTFPVLYSPVNSGHADDPNGLNGPDFDPNRWVPLDVPNGTLLDRDGNPTYDPDDSSTYSSQSFLTPHWGAVRPFAMEFGGQFRPPPPPRLGSSEPYTDALGNVSTEDEAYRSQTAAVLDFSAQLTDERKVIAEFWADGPTTWTPPGHWVQLAIGISLRDGHGIEDDAKMFMVLAGALLDAGISAWETKRHYDFIRPISAIRYLYRGVPVDAWGGPNKGTVSIEGSTWQPYQSLTFVTPPFAEYTSGHSTFSRASAEVLTAFAGSPAMYDGTTLLGRDHDGDGDEDLFGRHVATPGSLMFEEGPVSTVVLTWDTFLDAADEAGVSRLYGGIHFQDGDLRGREAGRQIGQLAFRWAELHWDPFGEMARTVDEYAASGEVTKGAATSLTKLIGAAAASFSGNRHLAGCKQLDALATTVAAHQGVGDTARAWLARQVSAVSASLCQ